MTTDADAKSHTFFDPSGGDRFEVTRRGYDRLAVDRHLRQLEKNSSRNKAESDRATERIRILEDQVSTLRKELADAKHQLREADRPSYSGLGERIEQLLRLAEEQSHELVAAARGDATGTHGRGEGAHRGDASGCRQGRYRDPRHGQTGSRRGAHAGGE